MSDATSYLLGGIAGAAVGLFGIIILFALFRKAGRRWWSCLIPVYNGYVFYDVSGLPGWWYFLDVGVSWLAIGLAQLLVLEGSGQVASEQGVAGAIGTLSLVSLLVGYVMKLPLRYFASMELAQVFGRSKGFGFGLMLLRPVFLAILAFGGARYGYSKEKRSRYAGETFIAVFNRELAGYFATPLAYVFLVIFLFFAGYLTFVKNGFYESRQADLTPFFMNMPLLFVFMVPATAMRLWAEERKAGSIELLFTLPITITQAVLGKFLAAWMFLGIALGLTFPMVLTVAYLGHPDGGLIATGYLGSFLMAGGFLAIGGFFSALSKNQVIAFVLAVVASGVLFCAGLPTVLNFLSSLVPAGLVAAIEGMSFQEHFESMQKGILQFSDLAYFVIMIAGWIAASAIMLDERKAS